MVFSRLPGWLSSCIGVATCLENMVSVLTTGWGSGPQSSANKKRLVASMSNQRRDEVPLAKLIQTVSCGGKVCGDKVTENLKCRCSSVGRISGCQPEGS